jgi:hypothetical protein
VAPEEMLPVMTEGGEVLCHRIRLAESRVTSS